LWGDAERWLPVAVTVTHLPPSPPMAASFIIALLLCEGDNCDFVRLEPTVTYPSYEACRNATSSNLGRLADLAKPFREPNRESERSACAT
jgi:hypothetical protein